MKVYLTNAYVINPKTNFEGKSTVLIEGGKIKSITQDSSWEPLDEQDGQVLDMKGKLLVPGLIDLHVHLREPGFEHKETIKSGTLACAKGGYTTVACMPNTRPCLDSEETLQQLKEIIEKDACIEVLPIGAITQNIAGEHLTDHETLLQNHCIALSDDGRTTMDEEKMRVAFRSLKKWGRPLITHSEDHEITEQYKDSVYPLEAETKIVQRDIELCKEENGKLHVAHVSGSAAVQAIRDAKAQGIKVTAEAAPHHFALNDQKVDVLSPKAKVNPPIRSEEHRKAVVQGILDGSIDIIATDHAPHDEASKNKPYAEAAYGISGIEPAFSIAYTTLVLEEGLSLKRLIEMMTSKPAEIACLENVGSIEPGYYANLTLIDLEKETHVQTENFESKGKNTPFENSVFKGKVEKTMFKGQWVYSS